MIANRLRSAYTGFRRSLSRWRDRRFQNTIFLVYSMGKVGSSSVYQTLKHRLPFAKVFHLHFLSKFWLNDKLPKLHSFFHSNIELGNRTLDYLQKHSSDRIKIITLVREPLMREISDAFENCKGLFSDQDVLNKEHLTQWMDSHDHEYTLTWFDTEFHNFTGFDIYSVPFGHGKGYSIYQLPGMDILCLKLERFNEVYHAAFKDFLGLDNLRLNKSNSSIHRNQRDVYRSLKESYTPSADKLKAVYSSKYMQHFYSDEEILSFSNEWTKAIKPLSS
jgi:hypothetical protein